MHLVKLLIVGFLFIAAPAASETVQGVTVANGQACTVSDLSTESMALISRWFVLNTKMSEPGDQGTLTDAERAEGEALFESGKCGFLGGEVPIVIILSDGTLNLGRLPDGRLIGFPAESFQRIMRICAPYDVERCINIRE